MNNDSDYFVRKSDVDRLITERIAYLNRGMARGKGLKNSIINLKALQIEISNLYTVKVGNIDEPIWRNRKT